MTGPGMPAPDVAGRCRACGAAAAEPLVLREMMFGLRERFAYRACGSCGSLSIDDVPADLGRFYPPSYYSFEAGREVRQDPAWRRMAVRALVGRRAFGRRVPWLPIARRLAIVPPEYQELKGLIEAAGLTGFDDRVLDVGCGAAPVRLAMLRKLGFRRLEGVEPFIPADLVYQGVPVRRGVLADTDGPYRLIMWHHSLEHVADPVAELRATAARLAPGGRCLVRTPMVGGYPWRTYGADWVELDAPRHLVVFSLAGLERAAALAGLEVVDVRWESGPWEFVASEQYGRDVAMYGPGSWFVDRAAAGVDDARLDEYAALAKRLVAEGDAGRAAIWLRRAGATDKDGTA